MVPRSIRVIERFPLNASGKYDRTALQVILETD
jgi:acyl-coenzyme A synthetase/AMP-(fatty) acid ligase